MGGVGTAYNLTELFLGGIIPVVSSDMDECLLFAHAYAAELGSNG